MGEAWRRTRVSEHLDEEDHLEDDLVSLHLGQEDKLCNFDNGDYVELDESDIESDDLEYESDLKTNLDKDETITQSVEKTYMLDRGGLGTENVCW